MFVDTGAWFASVVTTDTNYAAACATLAQGRERMLTTDYVVDETLTLLSTRARCSTAIALGERLFDGDLCEIVHVTALDVENAWQLFRRFADKEWSFTDCTSYVVMERLNINTAFAFDHHFKQFGSVTVVP